MAQIKLLKISSNGLPLEMNTENDDITLASFTVEGGGPVLSGTGLDMLTQKITNLPVPTDADDAATKAYVDGLAGGVISIDQAKFVAKNGNDTTGDGTLGKPYASISKALTDITDATPTKRYAIMVSPGNYTEAAIALKANVFVVGSSMRAVRITGAVSLASDFTGSADHRSGFSNVTLLSAVDLNWTTVTSAAGKIYCDKTLFSASVTMYGYNNAIAQAQFDSCQFFGLFTISGINVGAHTNNLHYGNIVMNQHPNGGMATILNAIGGTAPSVVVTAAVNNFTRRCSLFAKEMWLDALTVDGPSAYADLTTGSVPNEDIVKLNGGNVVYLNTVSPGGVRPDENNSRYIGDFGKQWFFNFAYVHASTGTDLYLTSTATSFGPDSAGRSIFIQPDGYGLNANVNGGDIVLETALVTGTGVRGKVDFKARELDMNAVKITELADPTSAQDAATKAYVDGLAGLSVTKNAAEAITIGDAVVLNASGEVAKADISTESLAKAVGIAANSAALGEAVKVILGGSVNGFTGLIAGDRYFLASSGSISSTAPTGVGEYIVQLGYAAGAGELVLSVQQLGQRS